MSEDIVIAGHSASEDARERACVPAIHRFRKKMDARLKAGHDGRKGPAT
jgi:hypothetical protein